MNALITKLLNVFPNRTHSKQQRTGSFKIHTNDAITKAQMKQLVEESEGVDFILKRSGFGITIILKPE